MMDGWDANEKAEVEYQRMKEPGKSDRLIVPEKQSNNADKAAEIVEGSGLTKGNAGQQNTRRAQELPIVMDG